jgi:SAM-dependent methyltransferase
MTRDNEQARIWNNTGGNAWVQAQDVLDRMLQPFADMLIDAVAARSRHQLLDVGCGTGSVIRTAAKLPGVERHCTGIDISAPMIAAARKGAEEDDTNVDFLCADAQTHAFAPASFDMIISRFGVMFFQDSVRAFANLRHAAQSGADLRFLAWRGAAENPFMTTAERAAAPLLPHLPPRKPDAPGQFAFADRHKIRHILEDSGWTGITIEPVDALCAFPESDLIRYATTLGPVGLYLQEADTETRAKVAETLRKAFAPYVQGKEVRFTAACWMVGAQA